MPRWIPRAFFCLFLYNTSVWAVGRVADGMAYLFAKEGSLDLWQMLHQHRFERALLVGLLGGIVPLETWLGVSGVLNRRIIVYLKRLRLDRLKPWIVVFYSPILLLALLQWMLQWFENRSRYFSVLGAASPYPFSEFFKGFLSTDCSNGGSWVGAFWGDNNVFPCMIHVQLISIWLLAVSYSLAPLVRKSVFPLFSPEHPVSVDGLPDKSLKESTMAEKTETK